MTVADDPEQRGPNGGRVVRLCTDDEDDGEGEGATVPRVRPLLASDVMGNLITTKEPAMPKGIYDRKPRSDKAAQQAAPEPKKRGRKPRALAVVPAVAAALVDSVKGRFDVSLDLRAGAVTINAESGSLTLAPDEVVALFAFLGRR